MKWILILMTWYGSVAPMTQDIPVRDQAACERLERRLIKDWKDAPREFVWITHCREDDRD